MDESALVMAFLHGRMDFRSVRARIPKNTHLAVEINEVCREKNLDQLAQYYKLDIYFTGELNFFKSFTQWHRVNDLIYHGPDVIEHHDARDHVFDLSFLDGLKKLFIIANEWPVTLLCVPASLEYIETFDIKKIELKHPLKTLRVNETVTFDFLEGRQHLIENIEIWNPNDQVSQLPKLIDPAMQVHFYFDHPLMDILYFIKDIRCKKLTLACSNKDVKSAFYSCDLVYSAENLEFIHYVPTNESLKKMDESENVKSIRIHSPVNPHDTAKLKKFTNSFIDTKKTVIVY